MDSTCIATKTRQGAFLIAEKMGRVHFLLQKNEQGAFLTVEKRAECIFSCRKMSRVHF